MNTKLPSPFPGQAQPQPPLQPCQFRQAPSTLGKASAPLPNSLCRSAISTSSSLSTCLLPCSLLPPNIPTSEAIASREVWAMVYRQHCDQSQVSHSSVGVETNKA